MINQRIRERNFNLWSTRSEWLCLHYINYKSNRVKELDTSEYAQRKHKSLITGLETGHKLDFAAGFLFTTTQSGKKWLLCSKDSYSRTNFSFRKTLDQLSIDLKLGVIMKFGDNKSLLLRLEISRLSHTLSKLQQRAVTSHYPTQYAVTPPCLHPQTPYHSHTVLYASNNMQRRVTFSDGFSHCFLTFVSFFRVSSCESFDLSGDTIWKSHQYEILSTKESTLRSCPLFWLKEYILGPKTPACSWD